MYCASPVVVYGIKIEDTEALEIKKNSVYKEQIGESSSEWSDEDSYDSEYDSPIKWETLNDFNKNKNKVKFLKAKHEFRDCDCCPDGDGEYNYYIGIDLRFFYTMDSILDLSLSKENIHNEIKNLACKYTLPYDISKIKIHYSATVY